MEITMTWTDITRPQYERNYGRYASDCSDEEWALIEPFMPERRSNGRQRTTDLREVWNAIQYMATTGCQWRLIPRRWVVERTFAWLGRCRRLAKDWEKTILSAESWLLIAHIKLVTRRIARH